ncbi:MAG TPA: hypothetical protein EYH15_00995 [Methanothermococcus okinawensis]|uniref:Glycosyltransferase 2-like domain-containing protein n=1 Tax=Methanothermococcus okinawensis TaxID=155863 RepID=A0A832ZAX6_9EURY|nr:hypothetical protein [Methanothermococcus okinawensis]
MSEKAFWEKYTLEKHNKLNFFRLEYIFFVAAGIGVSFLFQYLGEYQFTSKSFLDNILINLKYVWLFYLPVAVGACLGLLLYRPEKGIILKRCIQKGDYKVIFQIVSRGFNKEAVKRAVNSVLYWTPKYLKNYEVWVVTEDDVDKDFFENLKELNREAREKVKVIYVPKDYETPNNTKYKARALNYALELRGKMGYNLKKTWIYIMDEESIVGEDTILGIIDFIEKQKGKLAGQGIIVYPNFWGKNILTSLGDSIRAGDDISRFRFQGEYGEVLIGIHGSHLLYRGDVEDRIGWDFGEIRAEDALFGILINHCYNKAYGWLKGKLYEQSPFSVKDYIKQRRRWFWGILDIILMRKDVGLKYKIIFSLHILSWLSTLPSITVVYINLLYPTPVPHPFLTVPFGFLTGTLAYVYWKGCQLNLQPLGKDSKLLRIINVFAIPLIGAMEGVAPWCALLTYKNSKNIGYEVIKK